MTEIAAIVDKHRGERGDLIAILEDIQTKYSYLPEEALRAVATQTGRSLVDIYGVATFYKWFSLKPRGKHLITCCLGTACHVRGAPRIADELERHLDVKAGETTADGEVTLETQNCLGGCALGPIVVADGHYFSNVGSAAVPGIVRRTIDGLERVDLATDPGAFPLEAACPRCAHSLLDAASHLDGYPAIAVSISCDDREGRLLLSAVYGSLGFECELEVPTGTEVTFTCPHCRDPLVGAGRCNECGAVMVPMMVRGGGVLQFCSRRGCGSQRLDLVEANPE